MSRKHYLIVDGYNIMHAWPDLISLMEMSLETARESLIDTMIEYAKSSGEYVILVFDAYDPKGNRTFDDSKGIDIVFTKEGETADSYIERLVDRLTKRSKKNIIRVASSDGMIQNIVLGRGAARISSTELKEMVMAQKRLNKRISTKLKKEIDKNLVQIDDEKLKIIEDYLKSIDKK